MPASLPPPPPPPALQASLRAPCPVLPQPADDRLTTLLDNHDQVTMRYHDCQARTAALIRTLDAWQDTARRWYCSAIRAQGLNDAGCPEAGR